MPRKKKKTNIQYTYKRNINICTCGNKDEGDTFTWAKLGGHLVLLCWDCTDALHKNTITKEQEKGLV